MTVIPEDVQDDIRGASSDTTYIRRESRSTRAALIAFFIAAPLAALVAGGNHLPLGGPDSLGTRAGWIAAALGAVVFATIFTASWRDHAPDTTWYRRMPLAKRIFDMAALTLAFGMLAYFAVIAVAQIFQQGFRGLTVDPLGGGVLAGLAAAAVCYVAVLLGARVSGPAIGAVAVAVLFMGTVASMVSSTDESWWQLHFSQLGNTPGRTGYRFNVALILTGLVLTVLASHVGHAFAAGMRMRGRTPGLQVRALTWAFAGIGLCLMLVGIFTDEVNKPLHVTGAAGTVVLFAVFAIASFWLIPGLPRDLLVFTGVIAAGIVVSILLWIPIGYYNLTGMELVAASLLFAWLLVFTRSADVYGTATAPARSGSSRGSTSTSHPA